MKITDLLKKQSICLDGKADSKAQVIREMVDLMAEGGNINDIDTYRETVFKREEEGTTGIGEGIAIPHGKTEAVSAPGTCSHGTSGGCRLRFSGRRTGIPYFPDRSTEYRGQCTSGSTQSSVHASDG